MEVVDYQIIKCPYRNKTEKSDKSNPPLKISSTHPHKGNKLTFYENIETHKDVSRNISPNRAPKRVISEQMFSTKVDKKPSTQNILICDDGCCSYKRNKNPQSNREGSTKNKGLCPTKYEENRKSYDSTKKDSINERQSYDAKIRCPYFKRKCGKEKKLVNFEDEFPLDKKRSKLICHKEKHSFDEYNNNHFTNEEKIRCPYLREKGPIEVVNSPYKHSFKEEKYSNTKDKKFILKAKNKASKRVTSEEHFPPKVDKKPSPQNRLICDDGSCFYKQNKSPESNREESNENKRLCPTKKYPYEEKRKSYDSTQKDSINEKQPYDAKIRCPYFKQNCGIEKESAHFEDESPLNKRRSKLICNKEKRSFDEYNNNHFTNEEKLRCPYFREKCPIEVVNSPYKDKRSSKEEKYSKGKGKKNTLKAKRIKCPYFNKEKHPKDKEEKYSYSKGKKNTLKAKRIKCPYFKEKNPKDKGKRCPYFRTKCPADGNFNIKDTKYPKKVCFDDGPHCPYYKQKCPAKERMDFSNRPSPYKNQGDYKSYEDCNFNYPEDKYSYIENIYSYDDNQDIVCQKPKEKTPYKALKLPHNDNFYPQNQCPYPKTEEPRAKSNPRSHETYPQNQYNPCPCHKTKCNSKEQNQLLNERCFCNYYEPCYCGPKDPCYKNYYRYLYGPCFSCARYFNCCFSLCHNVNHTLLNLICFRYCLCKCGYCCRPNPFYYYYYMNSFAHVAAIAVASGIFWFLFGAKLALPYYYAVRDAFTNQFPTELGGMSLPPVSTPLPILEVRRKVREPRIVKFCFKQHELLNVAEKGASSDGVVNVVMSALWIEVVFVVLDIL
ncbi:hypothetical protein JYU34_001270 [Plutella xylostella]|uniref:Uncharacterized protein n=1 Tax=Plutella xylostella TaxID=51655 RepID=A0ABQ7R6G7_PLUXY|nr:hypothetical protein JYU34_001270 [Plutella xylostella]